MDRRDRNALKCLAAALLVAVLAMGGATRWAQALTVLPAIAGLGFVFTSRRALSRLSPLLALLGLALAWTLIQLVPLANGMAAGLSPTLSALRADGLNLVGASPQSTLTMDVPGSLRAVSMFLTLGAVAIVAIRVSATERGRYGLLASVGGVIAIAAVVSLVHQVVGASRLYGVIELRQGSRVLGPLLNPNHLGCLMAMGVVTNIALATYARQATTRRLIWTGAALCCLAAMAATTSRGAILALGLGTLALLTTLLAQRVFPDSERQSRRKRELLLTRALPIGVLIACGLVVALYVGASGVVSQLQSTKLDEIQAPTSKFAAWRSAIVLVQDSPWVGVGRGAFEPTFTRVHPASAFVTFSHAENVAVQAVVEWGIPIAVLLGLLAGWIGAVALRRWRDGALAAGAIGALACVVFQSNFDFAIELLGVAVPSTVLAATLCYVPLKELGAPRMLRARGLRLAHVCGLLVVAGLLLARCTRTLEDDHLVLTRASSASDITESIRRHPLDYYAYALRAEQLLREHDPEGVALLNHAMRLHPTLPGLHRLAARLLARGHHWDQAQLEIELAIRYSADLRPTLAEAVELLPPERAAAAIPTEREVGPIVRVLQDLKREDVAIRWLDNMVLHTPTSVAADTLYGLAMSTKDFGAAQRAQRARCKLAPSDRCTIELAKVLVTAEQRADAIAVLADVNTWHGRRDEQLEGWLLLCDLQIAAAQTTTALECVRRLQTSGLVGANDGAIQTRLDALQGR